MDEGKYKNMDRTTLIAELYVLESYKESLQIRLKQSIEFRGVIDPYTFTFDEELGTTNVSGTLQSNIFGEEYKDQAIVTSPVIGVFEVQGDWFVETVNSVYKLGEPSWMENGEEMPNDIREELDRININLSKGMVEVPLKRMSKEDVHNDLRKSAKTIDFSLRAPHEKYS